MTSPDSTTLVTRRPEPTRRRGAPAMDDIVRTAGQIVTLARVRDYVEAMGLVDTENSEELSSRLDAARNLLAEVSETVTQPTADDALRVAEQVVTLEAGRAILTEAQVITTTDTGRLLGHLMTTEVQLMKVARVFAEPATT
ncbi:hypothetical protein [Streptomyces violaceusniger]|uniref:hypothetical protein n=1 Tax=Streptomyces violaceusniger TaxID=68280 RepID=UPI00382F0DD2